MTDSVESVLPRKFIAAMIIAIVTFLLWPRQLSRVSLAAKAQPGSLLVMMVYGRGFFYAPMRWKSIKCSSLIPWKDRVCMFSSTVSTENVTVDVWSNFREVKQLTLAEFDPAGKTLVQTMVQQ